MWSLESIIPHRIMTPSWALLSSITSLHSTICMQRVQVDEVLGWSFHHKSLLAAFSFELGDRENISLDVGCNSDSFCCNCKIVNIHQVC